MKKVFMFSVFMLFFACNKEWVSYQPVSAYYFVKNTSNQTISFDVSIVKGEPVVWMESGHGEQLVGHYSGLQQIEKGIYTFTVNANDSIIFGVSKAWEDLKNHPNWFTKFEISPVDGIRMSDPYLPEYWAKYGFYDGTYHDSPAYGGAINKPVPAYLFSLNEDGTIGQYNTK